MTFIKHLMQIRRYNCVVCLDLSKAFDKVWHVGLLYKLKCMGICEKYFGSFLCNRYQTVLFIDRTSKWSQIKAGSPQGSILGPLLFLMYSKYLSEGSTSNAKLFAKVFLVVRDYTSLSLSLIRTLTSTRYRFLTPNSFWP